MAPPVGSLVVRIGSDIRGLITGFRKGGKAVKDFGAVAGRVAKRIALLTTASAAAATAIGVVLTRQGLKSIDAMAKFARVIGVSTEALAGLQLAAKETADFTDQQFNLAFQRMTRRIAEAAQGSGEAQGAIKALGLDAKALAEAGPDEAFLSIADAMQDVTDQGERLRLGFKLFDSEGARLVNTLAIGRSELEGYAKEAAALGLAFSEIDARQVEAANDAMGRIGAVIAGISRRFAIELAPFIKNFADKISNAARDTKGFGEQISSGLEGGIELAVLFARALRLAAIAGLATAVAAQKLKSETETGNEGLTRFLARARLVGDATATMELDRQFRQADAAAADAGVEVTGLQKTLQKLSDSSDLIDAVEESLKGIGDRAREERDAAAEPEAPDRPRNLGDISEETEQELEILRERNAQRLEVIRQGLLSEREIEDEAFAEKLARLEEGRALQNLGDAEFKDQKERLEEEHQARLTEIEGDGGKERARMEAEMMRNRIAAVSGFFAQQTAILASAAEDNFKLQKALSIASAVLSGIESVIHAYNFGARIGGPALGAAFGAIAAGVQFARIAQISSQQFQRGSSGGAAGGGGSTGGAPAPPGGGGGGAGGGAGAQSVNISLVGDRFGRTQVRDLIEEINDAVADGARLRIV